MDKEIIKKNGFNHIMLPGSANILGGISILLSIAFMISSCDRYPDAGYTSMEYYTFSFLNKDGMRLFSQDTFPGKIEYYIRKLSKYDDDSLFVDFRVLTGGGSVLSEPGYANPGGIATTRWKLGSKNFKQVLRASAYNQKGDFLTSTDLVAYGFRTDNWDTLQSSGPECYIDGMVADTVAKKTFMVAQCKLFRQDSHYFDWIEVNDANVYQPRTIDIDTNSVIYISTWNGEVVKSTDHGTTWTKCTKPFPDNPYYIYLQVSNDNWLWAYKWEEQYKYSSDGGTTWHDGAAELTADGLGNVFRLKDGSLLHLATINAFSKSVDNGLTWTRLPCPPLSTKLYLIGNNNVMIYSQENVFSLYMSTDNANSFQKVASFYPIFGTSYDNHLFTRSGNLYYVSIPGYGIVTTSDLVHYDNYWLNQDLLDLFMDHNGVLMAKDRDYKTVYYRKNTVK